MALWVINLVSVNVYAVDYFYLSRGVWANVNNIKSTKCQNVFCPRLSYFKCFTSVAAINNYSVRLSIRFVHETDTSH